MPPMNYFDRQIVAKILSELRITLWTSLRSRIGIIDCVSGLDLHVRYIDTLLTMIVSCLVKDWTGILIAAVCGFVSICLEGVRQFV